MALKILHVTGGLEPELGGTTIAVLNYVAVTAMTDVQSHLLVPIDDDNPALAADLREKIRRTGSEITLVPRARIFKGRASRWGISFGLARWLSRHAREFDVIVMHGGWMFSSVAALAAGRLAGKPCVLIPHESLSDFDVNRKGSAVRIAAKTLLKLIYGRYCGLFLFTSNVEAANSFPKGSTAKSSVFPLPLFGDRVASLPRRRGADAGAFRVGFLGRLHEKKNVNILLESLALLPELFSLTIGGDGPVQMRRSLEVLAGNLGIGDRVVWKGFVPETEKDAFFESIDVLVMPSDFESFGIVAAEAMIRGVPAIVSPSTGAAEIIDRHGGGIVVPAEAKAIAAALSSLIKDPARTEKLSAEAIDAATSQLSFSRIGPKLYEEYSQLASG